MPLAIYSALEADVGLAVSLSLVMLGVAVALLFAVRLVPSLWVNTDAKGGRDELAGRAVASSWSLFPRASACRRHGTHCAYWPEWIR